MKSIRVKSVQKPLHGTLSFPGDKSLSHRAIIFGSLAAGQSSFTNVLASEDCVHTREAFEALGVKMRSTKAGQLEISGKGLHALKAPKKTIYLGNSGTSMRLLAGILAGQSFQSVLTGDESLEARPMKRVTDYLKQMGAEIEGRDGGNLAPLKIKGGDLRGIDVKIPVASAQVKSALLLAGLYAKAKDKTSVTEPLKSRDHTENFLKFFGAKIKVDGLTVSIEGGQELQAQKFKIAGDISSAAFFMVLAALIPDSQISFESVLWNPTRNGIASVLEKAGVEIKIQNNRFEGPEPVADFSIQGKNNGLQAFEIEPQDLPSLIDELPILMVLATQAKGESVIRQAHELRVKETDRIESMVSMLSKMGADIRVEEDTIFIKGPTPLHGATVHSFKDHRTAMSLIVAGCIAKGETIVEDVECINTSFPNFFELLETVGASHSKI